MYIYIFDLYNQGYTYIYIYNNDDSYSDIIEDSCDFQFSMMLEMILICPEQSGFIKAFVQR
jgi:hypothetical protein